MVRTKESLLKISRFALDLVTYTYTGSYRYLLFIKVANNLVCENAIILRLWNVKNVLMLFTYNKL